MLQGFAAVYKRLSSGGVLTGELYDFAIVTPAFYNILSFLSDASNCFGMSHSKSGSIVSVSFASIDCSATHNFVCIALNGSIDFICTKIS